MRRLGCLLAFALALLALPPLEPALALPVALPVTACDRCDGPRAGGGDGSITVTHGKSDHVPGRGSATQGKREGRDYSYVREYATPACSGNRLHGDDALCQSALTSCRVPDQIRFWIWHQRVEVKVGPPPRTTYGDWVAEDGSYCLGPDDPGVPDIVLTLAAAQRAFEQRVTRIAPPTVRTVPGPRTLVHYPTRFTAVGADPFTDDVRVLGATVHLNVRPESYRWTFGDGTTRTTAGPTTSHTYPVKGRRVVRVDVTWGGWFTVDHDRERFEIDPPATSTGRRGRVTVVEARAENLA